MSHIWILKKGRVKSIIDLKLAAQCLELILKLIMQTFLPCSLGGDLRHAFPESE